MIIVISDVHLGYEKCNKDAFKEFVSSYLVSEEIDHLILLGDIMDFWRKSPKTILRENRDIFSTLESLDAQKHYIIGNHDYTFCQTKQFHFRVAKELSLRSGEKRFRFIHGHQIEYSHVLSFYEGLCRVLCTGGDGAEQILNKAWDFYSQNLKRGSRVYSESGLEELSREELDQFVGSILEYPEEKPVYSVAVKGLAAQYRERVGMDPEVTLVYGHTHAPYVEETEVNCGCWVSDSGRPNSYVTIVDGTVTVDYWDQEGLA